MTSSPCSGATILEAGTHQPAGRDAEAGPVWRPALQILEDLGHPDAGQVAGRMRLVDAR